MEYTKGFEGHITAEFNFDVVDVFRCHFRMHTIAVVSFKPDMIIVQTMVEPYEMPNIDIKGLYTTIIPLSSLKVYEYDCNLDEVNIIVSEKLVTGLPRSSKILCVNVVKDEPFSFYDEECNEISEDAVEVSFDIAHLKKNCKVEIASGFSFGRHVNEPYPHFLIKSRIHHTILEDYITRLLNSDEVQSILVKNVKAFKSFYSSPNLKIKIGKDGSIIFYGSSSKFGVMFAIGSFDCEIDFEAPRVPFKSLLKFIGSSKSNFEILKTILPEFIIRDKYHTTYAAFNRIF